MENHQLIKQEIPLIQNIKASAFVLIHPNQTKQDIKFYSYFNQVLSKSIPPFNLTKLGRTNCKQLEQNKISIENKQKMTQLTNKILSYTRKNKSLTELTQKFIKKFEGCSPNTFNIGQVTKELQVERRRIYDIINIMESLRVVSKIKKNVYEWKGLKRAVEVLNNINNRQLETKQFLKSKKEKSLGYLATQFLQLFCRSKNSVSLQQAGHIILKQSKQSAIRTKYRRLYDIMNVFKCLKLVKKVKGSKQQGAKSRYQWLGSSFIQKIIEQKQFKNSGYEIDQMNQQQSCQQNDERCQNDCNLLAQQQSKQLKNNIIVSQNQSLKLRDISNSFKQSLESCKIQQQRPVIGIQFDAAKTNFFPHHIKRSFTFCHRNQNYILTQRNNNIKPQPTTQIKNSKIQIKN